MKYLAIISTLFCLLFLWRFTSAAMEQGLPAYPVYYISAVIGLILGFLTNRLDRMIATRRRFAVIIIIAIFLLFAVSITFYNSGVEILRIAGVGLYSLYFFSLAGFLAYFSFRKWRFNKKSTESG